MGIMSKYDSIESLSDGDFRRLAGVEKSTFVLMLEVLKPLELAKRARGGKQPRLSLPDRLLMCLEYLREYRTYFHLGQSYGVSEAQCYKICRWIEEALIKDKRFHLPGKKALIKPDADYATVLVDATESPVERPKKTLQKQTKRAETLLLGEEETAYA